MEHSFCTSQYDRTVKGGTQHRYILMEGHNDKVCVQSGSVVTWAAHLSLTRHDLLGPPTHIDQGAPALPPLPTSQGCIDWNRELLKRELGLTERDIVDIPQLFKTERKKAVAFFPDLVRPPS